FALNNEISLGVAGGIVRNYEIGTIAHIDFGTSDIPHDDEINKLLEAMLDAYDRVIDAPSLEPETPGFIGSEAVQTPEPYGIEHAVSELFLEQSTLERLHAIWTAKKNLILQGAPGVGKSFVAKRLAYLLLGEKDAGRVETIQFHQSYSYE